jgi:hypothetical protein
MAVSDAFVAHTATHENEKNSLASDLYGQGSGTVSKLSVGADPGPAGLKDKSRG